ncbi:hypothetical protein J2R98_001741 [Alkalibacillus filiformis]|uniref:Endospore appendages core domain-containing protein n=1 Tax=Alkalibacillus filiformis TaxID=200990 RepID=A0ABU0DU93_9BACI|nr:S-Ena type endospore appendage [Alkalibacillus filiformis]MDQ0351909.1 hypothetical protein [Alkalibacillus filiformis]
MISCKKDHGKPCCEKKHKTECVTCEWEIVGGQSISSQTIYTTSGICPIVSGKIKYCHASNPGGSSADTVPNRIRVEFLRGGTVVQSQNVFLGSCLAFTLGGFDKIRVDRGGFDGTTITGELCINTSFAIH